jgi:MoaA/NifB/PqqE/SkfB family radical SAM enzyme
MTTLRSASVDQPESASPAPREASPRRSMLVWSGAQAMRAGRRLERVGWDLRARWLRWRHGYAELPEAVQLNVARPCNLRCRMCPYLDVHKDERRARYMAPDTFEALLPLLRLVRRVHFCGAGEPTFNPHLLSFMRRVRQVHRHKELHLTTNGTRLTEPLARALIELRLHKLHVSIDGASAPTMEAIRRNVDFALVESNVRRLVALKRAQRARHPIVMANHVMGYGNYAELVEFVRFAADVGIDEVQLLEMQPATYEDFADNLFNNLERDGGRTLREAVTLAERHGILVHLPLVLRNACSAPFSPQIGEDGELYPCAFLSYGGRPFYSQGRQVRLPGVSYGNAARDGFKAVWESPAYVELRRRDLAGDFPDYCRDCYLARIPTSERVREVFSLA